MLFIYLRDDQLGLGTLSTGSFLEKIGSPEGSAATACTSSAKDGADMETPDIVLVLFRQPHFWNLIGAVFLSYIKVIS